MEFVRKALTVFNFNQQKVKLTFLLLISLILSGQVIAAEQWTWENPYPLANNLNGVWGLSSNDVYGVGTSGAILHYDGLSWSHMQSNTTQNFHDVWGSSANNIYAVGETHGGSSGSIVMHYDGSSWTEQDIGSDSTLLAVWGLSANDIYIGGHNGRMYHYDGALWSLVNTGSNRNVNGIWGTATDNIFAVGARGTIRRFNGSYWYGMNVPFSATSFDLKGIWGTSSNNIYVVGGKYENSSYHAIILHYDGTQWTEALNVSGYGLSSISGSAADFIYAASDGATGIDPVVLKFNGSIWQEVNTGLSKVPVLKDVITFSENDAIFVANLGSVIHWDGVGFSNQKQGATSNFKSVWCGSNNTSIAVGDQGATVHFDGNNWSVMSSGLSTQLRAVWGNSNNEVFAVGRDGQIIFYDGVTWSSMTSGTTSHLYSVWGSSASDVFAAGDGVILHYDGVSWSNMSLPFIGNQLDYEGIWGSAPNNVYTISYSGRLLHYDGTSWTELTVNFPAYASDIWGTSATDIRIAFSSGQIFGFDGTSWTEVASGISWVNSLTASSTNNYYSAGSFGRAFHYDGTGWVDLDTPTRQTFYDVCIRSDNSAVMVGNQGSILSYGLINEAPDLTIQLPLDGSAYEEGTSINLGATASDVEDGDLSPQIQWYSSLDGIISSPVVLTLGNHLLMASVIDSGGLSVGDSVNIEVLASGLDKDGDGMPNGWEIQNGLNPSDPLNATDNPDGDALNNYEEYLNNSNPNVSDNILGDINNDGVINVVDLLLMQRHIFGLSLLEIPSMARGDLYPVGSGDDVLNISDLLLLTQMRMSQ